MDFPVEPTPESCCLALRSVHDSTTAMIGPPLARLEEESAKAALQSNTEAMPGILLKQAASRLGFV